LGGRLDATNVLTPHVSVITPISFDHVEILGDSLGKIASEKAGIIKPETPIVVAPQEPEALDVIRGVARAQHAPLLEIATELHWEAEGSNTDGQVVAVRRVQDETATSFHLPLLGPHQRVNLASALSTAQVLRQQGWKIGLGALQQGAQRVQWHARFEILARPRPPGANPGEMIWSTGFLVADGAHNRASARELRRTLDEVFPNSPVHFVFGASSDKDIRGMFGELLPRAASVTLTRSRHARAATPDALARVAAPFLVPIHTAATLAEALLNAKNIASPTEIVCITGSLFVAAEAREIVLGIPRED
jgi:dihydrofolate synthase/folylpolyglutamate synthase